MTFPASPAHLVQTLADRALHLLSAHRRHHVLGVTHTAITLAQLHGLDRAKAAVAGLLHDLSKEFPPENLRRELLGWGVEIPADDLPFPKTWHGLHAAHWAIRELGLDDRDIHEAVTLHTTADAEVGPLARALYIADFAEPGRGLAPSGQILAVARRNLDEGFRAAMVAKLGHVKGRKGDHEINPRALRAARAWLGGEFSEPNATASV